MAWQDQASSAGTCVWSASAVIIAAVELCVALLVLLCSVITCVTSSFIRLSGLHVPCSCVLYHHLPKEPSEEAESEDVRLKSTRSGAGEKSGSGDRRRRPDFQCRSEATVGSDLCCSSSCESSAASGAPFQEPMQLANAAEGEPAEGDHAEQSQTEKIASYKSRYEPELEEALQEREALAALYVELEKERNASATAANEAMGMIARLQEEKAAVLMEARQFQRMVEEKSMHDQEAIEALRNGLTKMEEEKSELEEENRFYRLSFLSAQMLQEMAQRAGRIENGILLLSSSTDPPPSSAEERSLDHESIAPSRTSRKKENTAAITRAANARAAADDQKQSEDTGRKQNLKNPIQGPVLAGGTEESSKAVAGLGLELGYPSRLDKATSLPSSATMGISNKKRLGKGLLPVAAKPEEKGSSEPGAEENNMTSKSRRMSSFPHLLSEEAAAAAAESLGEKRCGWDEEEEEELSDRAIEERRLSVLEYVWKLEEELHQQQQQQREGRWSPAPAPIRKSKSVGVSSSKTQSPIERMMTSTETETTEAARTIMSAMTEEDNSNMWQILSESDGRNTAERNLHAFSSLPEVMDGSVTPFRQGDKDENKEEEEAEEQEAGASAMCSGGKEITAGGECGDEVRFEHDVYEVPEPAYEITQGIAGELKGTRRSDSNRLGKPDLFYSREEDRRDCSEMEEQARSVFTVPLYGRSGRSGTNIQWEELCWRGLKKGGDLSTYAKIKRRRYWTSVEDEVWQLTLRLKALEADRHLMKQTIDSLTMKDGERKLLQEIARQSRELRGMLQCEGLQQQQDDSLQLDSSSFQVGPNTAKKRYRFTAKPRASSCRLGHLLHISSNINL